MTNNYYYGPAGPEGPQGPPGETGIVYVTGQQGPQGIAGASSVLNPTTVLTGPYTAAAGDFAKFSLTGGSIVQPLPQAPADKSIYAAKIVATTGTNTLTLNCQGSDVLNITSGSTSYTLKVVNQSVTLQYQASGAIWNVIADDLPLGSLTTWLDTNLSLDVPFVVIKPSGDSTGATDTAAWAAAITTLGGASAGIGTIRGTYGTYYFANPEAITSPNINVEFAGSTATLIKDKSTAGSDCFNFYNPSFVNVAGAINGTSGGHWTGFTIDGTSNPTGCGFHFGDSKFALIDDVVVGNYSGSGGKGFHFDNRYGFMDRAKVRIRAYNCATLFCFDVHTATGGSQSFGIGDWYLDGEALGNQNVVTFQGTGTNAGPWLYRGTFTLVGSSQDIATSNSGKVLNFTNQYCRLTDHIEIQFEADGTGGGNVGHQSMFFTSGAFLRGWGSLCFYQGDGAAFQASNVSADSSNVTFDGAIYVNGDTTFGTPNSNNSAPAAFNTANYGWSGYVGSGEIYLSGGDVFPYTLASGAQALTFTGQTSGFTQKFKVVLTQPASGAAGTLSSVPWTWLGGAPTLSTANGAVDVIDVFTNNGSTYYGVRAIAGSSRSVTVTVAASNSSATSKASADYVCTGTNDDVTVGTAVAGGGHVVMLAGDYYWGNTGVNLSNSNGTWLQGSGYSETTIHVPAAFSGTAAILMSSAVSSQLSDMFINYVSQGTGTAPAIWSQCNYPRIRHVQVQGSGGHGFVIDGGAGNVYYYNALIEDCVAVFCGSGGTIYDGFYVTQYMQNGVLSHCWVDGGNGGSNALLTTALTNGQTGVTSLQFANGINGPVTSGDTLLLVSPANGLGASTTQAVTATQTVAANATSITVTSFTANAAYGANYTAVVDRTVTNLANSMITRYGFNIAGASTHLDYCHPYRCYEAGLRNTGPGSQAVYVTGGEYETNGWCQIYLYAANGSIITGITSYSSPALYGVFIVSQTEGSITGNTIDAVNGMTALWVNFCNGMTISGNLGINANGIGGTTYEFANSTAMTITGNNCWYWKGTGAGTTISVYAVTDSVISGNNGWNNLTSTYLYSVGGTNTNTVIANNGGLADVRTQAIAMGSMPISGLATTLFTENTVTVATNAGTVPVTYAINKFTNSSAATMTITMATASAIDGQITEVRIYDFSAVAETITWVNTENSTVSAPTTSNGSTTLPLSVWFQYNSATSKWRCILKA